MLDQLLGPQKKDERGWEKMSDKKQTVLKACVATAQVLDALVVSSVNYTFS